MFFRFFIYKVLRDGVKKNCVIIKLGMILGNLIMGNWIEFIINYFF